MCLATRYQCVLPHGINVSCHTVSMCLESQLQRFSVPIKDPNLFNLWKRVPCIIQAW